MLTHDYDAILLDAVLPKKNGFQIIAGANDYLAKPFRFDELLARLRALHRRGAGRLDVLRCGSIMLDRIRHRVTVNDRSLELTPKEFQLLEYFLLHSEAVIRRTPRRRTC